MNTPNPKEFHIIDPKYYVIDAMEEGCTEEEVLSICGMRENFIRGVANWFLLCVGETMEDIDIGIIEEQDKCPICFRDEEGLKLKYLANI